MEGLRLFEMSHTVKEGQLAGFIAFFEIVQKLVPEQLGQNPYGKEESFSAGNPAVMGKGQPTAGDNTVDVGMVHEVLSPGVDNTHEADVYSETLWVLCQFPEGLGDRAEEKVIQDSTVP